MPVQGGITVETVFLAIAFLVNALVHVALLAQVTNLANSGRYNNRDSLSRLLITRRDSSGLLVARRDSSGLLVARRKSSGLLVTRHNVTALDFCRE